MASFLLVIILTSLIIGFLGLKAFESYEKEHPVKAKSLTTEVRRFWFWINYKYK